MKKSIGLVPHLEILYGVRDQNLQVMQKGLKVSITEFESSMEIAGPINGVKRAIEILEEYRQLAASATFNECDIPTLIKSAVGDGTSLLKMDTVAAKRTGGHLKKVQPKSAAQQTYLDLIESSDMVFGIGPAGTGKTYLAMSMAISALVNKKVERIILTRPAVEAGERLGFLPGTLQEKVDPYLRPLYDAMHEMLSGESVERYMAKGVIEAAPVAFMRGRTLKNAFVILDEGQNTTQEQMKMFLTRLGEGSKAVITGDITQIDLPNPSKSGLVEALAILQGVEGIQFQHFTDVDVVRHPLVQRIVKAYESAKR